MKGLEQWSSMSGFLLFKDHFGWCRETRPKGPRVMQGDESSCPDRQGKWLGPVLVQRRDVCRYGSYSGVRDTRIC